MLPYQSHKVSTKRFHRFTTGKRLDELTLHGLHSQFISATTIKH